MGLLDTIEAKQRQNKMAKVNSGKRHSQHHRIDRRQKINLWGRAKSPVNKRPYPLGQHGPLARTKLTDYGKQLHAKQRIKAYYASITEKKFRRYYDTAVRMKGDLINNFMGLLETRLDAVVYRAKFAPTPFAARQFVSHGHVLVNGKRITIPSYQVKEGDVISIAAKAQNIPALLEGLASNERDFCDYITTDIKKFTATLIRIPEFNEIPYPVEMEPQLVIEFYSRQ